MYELDREVGRGAFAAVYLATRKSDGYKVAIKRVLRKSRNVGVDWTALREIKLMQELRHVNLVGVSDFSSLITFIDLSVDRCVCT